jgi:hypothetical protein
MSAFYPGAGFDFTPTIHFPHIRYWYYFDSMYGVDIDSFKKSLRSIAIQYEFIIVEEDTCWICNNKQGQIIEYHIGASFPEDLDRIPIETCTTLVAIGLNVVWPITFLETWREIIIKKNEDCIPMNYIINANVYTMIVDTTWHYFMEEQNTKENALQFIEIKKV